MLYLGYSGPTPLTNLMKGSEGTRLPKLRKGGGYKGVGGGGRCVKEKKKPVIGLILHPISLCIKTGQK